MAHLPARSVLIEQLVELARLVDAAGDEHGVAAAALQAVAGFHVHQDVGDDLFQPRLTATAPSASCPSAA